MRCNDELMMRRWPYRVPESRPDQHMLVLSHDVVFRVALVLDAQVIRQSAVQVEGSFAPG
jgi:hypothetical protein